MRLLGELWLLKVIIDTRRIRDFVFFSHPRSNFDRLFPGTRHEEDEEESEQLSDCVNLSAGDVWVCLGCMVVCSGVGMVGSNEDEKERRHSAKSSICQLELTMW